MKKFIFYFCLIFSGFIACIPQGFTATQNQLITLGKVDGEKTETQTILHVRFDKKPPWKELYLDHHGKFIQFALPLTVIPESGKFIDIDSPMVEKIAFFQVSETQGMGRIFLDESFDKIKDLTDVEVLENRIVITLNHSALGPNSKESEPEMVASAQKSTKSSSKNSKKKNEVESKQEPGFFAPQPQLTTLAGISLLFFLLFIGAVYVKKLTARGRFSGFEDHQEIKMRALSHLSLAPKQRLSLIQVGGEKILLSVTPDQVNLITHLQDKDQRMLGTTIPSVQTMRPMQSSVSAAQAVQKKLPQSQAAAWKTQPNQPQNNQPLDSVSKPQSIQKPVSKPSQQNQKTASSQTFSQTLDTASGNQVKPKNIQYSISDAGVKRHHTTTKPQTHKLKEDTQKAIEDVTKLIREKLKNLPKV